MSEADITTSSNEHNQVVFFPTKPVKRKQIVGSVATQRLFLDSSITQASYRKGESTHHLLLGVHELKWNNK